MLVAPFWGVGGYQLMEIFGKIAGPSYNVHYLDQCSIAHSSGG